MNYSLDQIRPVYEFNVSASGTVSYANKAFLEGENFEGVIKLAISVGGDSDTIAAIAGSLAECFYAIPDNLAQFATIILQNIIEHILKAEEIWGLIETHI